MESELGVTAHSMEAIVQLFLSLERLPGTFVISRLAKLFEEVVQGLVAEPVHVNSVDHGSLFEEFNSGESIVGYQDWGLRILSGVAFKEFTDLNVLN